VTLKIRTEFYYETLIATYLTRNHDNPEESNVKLSQ